MRQCANQFAAIAKCWISWLGLLIRSELSPLSTCGASTLVLFGRPDWLAVQSLELDVCHLPVASVLDQPRRMALRRHIEKLNVTDSFSGRPDAEKICWRP